LLRELIEEEIPLREQLNEIDRQKKELEKTARVIGLDNTYGQGTAERQPKTIKEAVLEILGRYPMGLTAMDILREINASLNTSYARTTLSPQLSRLKHEGKIMQSGIVWLLKT
jgi:hypothetical protein